MKNSRKGNFLGSWGLTPKVGGTLKVPPTFGFPLTYIWLYPTEKVPFHDYAITWQELGKGI